MLFKLAWGNVRRAGKDYLVYLLTLTLAVTVFYAFNTISVQAALVLEEEGLPELLSSIMSGLTIFLAVVMGFLMVYANNFIMKRRKKEFGLYQVLGMSRGQVSRVMALETAIVSGAALVLGIVLGVAFSQLMTFFTASLFKTQIRDFHFFFSIPALLITMGCLVAIFLVTLLFNLGVVRRAKVIDLMSANRKNEAIKTRNPILSAAIFILGAIMIGIAYYRLLRDGLPVDAAPSEYGNALTQFMDHHGHRGGGHHPVLLRFFGLFAQGAPECARVVLARPQHVHHAPAFRQGEHGEFLHGDHLDDLVPRHYQRDGRYVHRQRYEHQRGALHHSGLFARDYVLRARAV